jgi:hypothetical protein
MTKTEIDRICNWEKGEVTCRGCGKTIHLFFNGGELDARRCCGYVYETEHVQIDLVISQETAGSKSTAREEP